MVANEDKSKILIELDTYICEEGREPNLLFTKKHLYPCFYKLALRPPPTLKCQFWSDFVF